MPGRLRAMLMSSAAVALGAAAALGAATPAFAKSDTQLTGPRAAHARNAFRLTITVGDDGGARPAWARLEQLGAHERYQWRGTWHRLRRADRDVESYVFTVTNQRGTATFRAVVSSGYAITNPVRVVVQ